MHHVDHDHGRDDDLINHEFECPETEKGFAEMGGISSQSMVNNSKGIQKLLTIPSMRRLLM